MKMKKTQWEQYSAQSFYTVVTFQQLSHMSCGSIVLHPGFIIQAS